MHEINIDNLNSDNENNSNFEESKFHLFKNIGLKDRFNFYEYIATMIDGGVTITDSLDSISSRVNSVFFKEKIKELKMYISSGDSFSKAMKKLPDIFPMSEASVVEAGEESGNLVESLNKLSEDLMGKYELNQKIKNAMTYPIIIFTFLIAAVIIVLVYVIPEISVMFLEQGIDLPFATRALISTSNFFVNYYVMIIFLIVAFIVSMFAYLSTATGKRVINYFVINSPLVGKVYRNYTLAHIAGSLGSLNAGGVSIVKTLKLVGESTGSFIYQNLLYDVSKDVAKGKTLVESMTDRDKTREFFPHDFLQMLSVGEKTATLEEVTQKIKKQYTKEVDYSLQSLVKWIEPIAILIAGVFVLWFAFAIFGAILQMTESAGV